jgi:hypothetical protein
MSQSAKGKGSQAVFQSAPARRGRARAAGQDALSHASAALAKAGFSDATLVLHWREIVGADIARIAQPVKLSQGPDGAVLTLRCEAGAAVFLQHQTRALLERINGYLGASRIARLRLVAGELSRSAEPTDHPGRSPTRQDEETSSPGAKLPLSEALSRLARSRSGSRPKRAD